MVWRLAQWVLASIGIMAVGLSVVFAVSAQPALVWGGFWLTPLNTVMVALISFIAWVVTRYAATQFAESHDEKRFQSRLLLTISAILFTVVSDHLIWFWLGWVSVSMTLHQLLVFYPERPRAVLAAHKKFIFARVAESLLAGAFLLLYWQHQVTSFSEVQQLVGLTWVSQIALLMLASVALIKCAQLPVHGWLLQVVEAPTPVSALLHAGIINLGGFLLLQLAPLLWQAPLTQTLLLVVAGLTMFIAACVTMTRVSVKVRLAWSTVAQMALMLVEIGLGLYSLALLHLLAHSCYKAHAFLSAGSAVEQAERYQLSGYRLPSMRALIAAITVSIVIAVGLQQLQLLHGILAPWVAIMMALTLWFATQLRRQQPWFWLRGISAGLVWLAMYLLAKELLSFFAPEQLQSFAVLGFADSWVIVLLLSIFSVYLLLAYQPQSTFSNRLFVGLNAGFYLDEWATRLTLRIWPITLPASSPQQLTQSQQVTEKAL